MMTLMLLRHVSYITRKIIKLLPSVVYGIHNKT